MSSQLGDSYFRAIGSDSTSLDLDAASQLPKSNEVPISKAGSSISSNGLQPITLADVNSFEYVIDGDIGVPGYEAAIGSSSASLIIVGSGSGSTPLDTSLANPNNNKIIVGYIDVSEAASYSTPDLFSGLTLPSWFGNQNPGYPGLYSVQYWNPAWLPEIETQINQLVSAGYNGVFLDVLNGDYEWSAGNPQGNPVYAGAVQAMATLVEEIRAYVTSLDLTKPFYIIGNNPQEIAIQYSSSLNSLDAIFNEGLYWGQPVNNGFTSVYQGTGFSSYLTSTLAQAYESAGIPIFGNDYPNPLTDLSTDFQTFAFYSALGWIPSVTTAAQTDAIFSTGPFMFMATAASPTVTGTEDFVNFLSGGLAPSATLNGGNDGDYFIGGPGQNSIQGGAGSDTIYAHPANAALDHILQFRFVNGDVNASSLPSVEILINGTVAAQPTQISENYNSPGYVDQFISIYLSAYTSITSIEIEVQGVYYTDSQHYNNVFLEGLTEDGEAISPTTAQLNSSANLENNNTTILFNQGGTAAFSSSALNITSPFLADTSDTINGGGGVNTVIYRAAAADYTIAAKGDNSWLVTALQTAEGPDMLSDVELLQFTDRTISLVAMGAFSGDFLGAPGAGVLIENTSGAVVVVEPHANVASSYTQVAALGPGWTFEGAGDFLSHGQSDFLIENTVGGIVVGEVTNGQAQYTQVGALGPQWIFKGTGDYLGVGDDQFLLQNASGAVVVAQVVNGQAQYTQVGALGSTWTFKGSGDFLGGGLSEFLLQNSAGAVVVGEVGSNHQATYTQVSALGVGWVFEGVGDFLGDGRSDFLIKNASTGAVVVGEVGSNDQTSYTQVGALGTQWVFEGVGDYSGTGTDSFLIENSATGALVTGTVVSGQAQYSQVGALGAGWVFPTGPSAIPVKDDLLGDQHSNILIQNSSTGAVVAGELSGGHLAYTQVSALGAGWSFEGVGDYLGDGQDQYLLQNSSGAVVVGEVQGGQTAYTQVGALGSGWTFEGTGNYLGDGRQQYLLQNSSGAVVVGEVSGGQTAYTQVSALGAGWTFEESGSFFGDGRSQFLIENTSGALVMGEVGSNAQTTYTQVGALGSGWTFEGAGDFLGDGRDQILIQNSSGAVVLGEVGTNSQESFTQIGAIGAQWAFEGAGDYAGTGTSSFLIENTSTGALVSGTVVSGQAQYTQVGALGSTWQFHG